MGLSSSFCGRLQKMNVLCNRVRNGRSRSSKVTDRGTNRTFICDFLLVTNSNLGPTLHRFWTTATYWLKNNNFPTPLLFKALAQGEPFKISGWTLHWQDYSPWAICRWRFCQTSLRRFDTVPVCNRQMDGRTCWWRAILKDDGTPGWRDRWWDTWRGN